MTNTLGFGEVRAPASIACEAPRADTAAPAVAPGSTQVEITLAADGDDTIMVLRHTGLPAAHRDEHRSGWGHFLPILAAVASHSRERMEEQ